MLWNVLLVRQDVDLHSYIPYYTWHISLRLSQDEIDDGFETCKCRSSWRGREHECLKYKNEYTYRLYFQTNRSLLIRITILINTCNFRIKWYYSYTFIKLLFRLILKAENVWVPMKHIIMKDIAKDFPKNYAIRSKNSINYFFQ